METSDGSALLQVRLTPKGGQDALTKWEANVLHARVAAPPVDGAANRALVTLLSRALRVARSRIAITRGDMSRDKALRIDGISADELNTRLALAVINQS